jgi:hypothetical protein
MLAMTLLGTGFVGCTSLPTNITLRTDQGEVLLEETRRTGSGLPSWGEGLGAFDAGDYNRAQEVFSSLSQRAESPTVRAKALYALACTRLILAKDRQGFQEALSLWAKWRDAAPSETREEDPRMMAPLLQRILPPDMVAVPSPGQRKGGDASAYQKAIRTKDEEIRSQEDEIQRLREQLQALEAIHRSIGEKKRGVTSP